MRHQGPVDEYRWLWTARPRRLNLGDLMCVVGLAALGSGALAMAARSGSGGAFGLTAALLFALQAAQWSLGGLPARGLRSRRETLLGIASYLLAMAMLALLCALAVLCPDAAALVIVALVVLVLYLSTWR